MLDLRSLEADPQACITQLTKRHFPHASQHIADLLQANQARKTTQRHVDQLAAKLKAQAQAIGKHLQAGQHAQATALKKALAAERVQHKEARQALRTSQQAVEKLLLALPNLPHEQVPPGTRAEDNRMLHTWQAPALPAGRLSPHWELLARHQLASFELGSKITGTGFPVLQGQGAQLQRALIQFFLAQAAQAGYQEIAPPLIVNAASALGTGQLPDKEGMMYALQDSGYYLIPTAEVPLTNLYRDTLVASHQLPLKHVACTPCFRREAGSWGSHVRGLNRLHQFEKVELVEVVHPRQAHEAFERMNTYVQGLLKSLGLSYRVLALCAGELGHAAALTHDIEVYSPGQQQWLEVSSITHFGTYQARRLRLCYQEAQQRSFCHTLNGSALALPRLMAALIEHHQTPQGIQVPPVLHPYTGFTRIG